MTHVLTWTFRRLLMLRSVSLGPRDACPIVLTRQAPPVRRVRDAHWLNRFRAKRLAKTPLRHPSAITSSRLPPGSQREACTTTTSSPSSTTAGEQQVSLKADTSFMKQPPNPCSVSPAQGIETTHATPSLQSHQPALTSWTLPPADSLHQASCCPTSGALAPE